MDETEPGSEWEWPARMPLTAFSPRGWCPRTSENRWISGALAIHEMGHGRDHAVHSSVLPCAGR